MTPRAPTRAAAVALAVLASGCSLTVDRYEVRYDTVFDAQAQEAVDRGWIPDFLPEDARDLRQVHETDGTAALLRATLAGDTPTPDACVPSDTIAPPATTAPWFPDDVTSRGVPLTCDTWVGVRDGETLWLWQP